MRDGTAFAVDFAAVGAAAAQTTGFAAEMSAAKDPLTRVSTQAVQGAGQFGGSLDGAVAAFTISWQSALDVFGTSATAIATLARNAVAHYQATESAVAIAAASPRGGR